MPLSQTLNNKRVVITGASMGIGAAVAYQLAAVGASVLINSSGKQSGLLQRVAEDIHARGGHVDYSYGDVSDWNYAGDLIEQCVDRYGGVDAVINLAGIAEPEQSSLLTILPKQWRRVIDVHLNGTFNTCHHAAPLMVKQGHGTIINTGSHAFLGSYGGTAYAAAKGAINSFSVAVAKDLFADNVRCNVVLPGAKTRLSSGEVFKRNMLSLHQRGLLNEQRLKSAMDAAPPENIAPIYSFLISDRADMITGQLLSCSGKHLGGFDAPAEEILCYRESLEDGPWSEDAVEEVFKRFFNS